MAFFFGFLAYSAAVMALVSGILFGAQFALTEPAPGKVASAREAKSGAARSSTASTKARKVPAAQEQPPASAATESRQMQQADAEVIPARTPVRKPTAKRVPKPGDAIVETRREPEVALGYAPQQPAFQHPPFFNIIR